MPRQPVGARARACGVYALGVVANVYRPQQMCICLSECASASVNVHRPQRLTNDFVDGHHGADAGALQPEEVAGR